MQPKLRLEGVLAERTDDLTRLDGINLDSLPKWLRDLIDINNEMAGRDTGRTQRFLVSGAGDDDPDSEEKKEERRFNELMRRLQDPEYALLYKEAANFVQDAEDAASRALDKLTRDGEAAAQKLDAIKDSAATLPDGRKVFRAADGRIVTEDGEDVSARRGEVRGLSERSPSWEEYQRTKQALDEIERRKREIDDYMRNVIDPFKRRLADPENPMTPDDIRRHLKDGKDKMPPALRAEFDAQQAHKLTSGPDAELPTPKQANAPVNSAAADELVPAKGINTPDMFAQFRSASAVVSSADPFAPMPGPKAS